MECHSIMIVELGILWMRIFQIDGLSLQVLQTSARLFSSLELFKSRVRVRWLTCSRIIDECELISEEVLDRVIFFKWV